MEEKILGIKEPPNYCQYAAGPCDQDFCGQQPLKGLVLYPSTPSAIAGTIESGTEKLMASLKGDLITWRDLRVTGQIIFCEICKGMRFADIVVADVTTLNLNLLFEIGYAIGLGKPVIPIRDSTYIQDEEDFKRLGMLDTLGYLDFQNSDQLAQAIIERLPVEALPPHVGKISNETPLYVLKGPIDTEGAVRMMSVLKKSPLRFRSYDPIETPRLSLAEARRQVSISLGVVANLLDPKRRGAIVHNARVALVAGLALASEKSVPLLQEGDFLQPIDYRDIVRIYSSAERIERVLEPIIRQVVISLQDTGTASRRLEAGLLERLDLGDVAAENETRSLFDYFVPTAAFQDARRGNARLVVGRKGSGKTAIFYAVRNHFYRRRSHLVLDLKPEGHQFTKFHDAVLSRLSPGLKEHTLVAFWNYILLAEMAQKIIDSEYSYSMYDPDRRRTFERLAEVLSEHVPSDAGDFSERLLRQVDRLLDRIVLNEALPETAGELTQALFQTDIPDLDEALTAYLADREEVWILVDNLDKGWPTRGASDEDILILRSLMEATRRLQRQFESRDVSLKALVFLRNDIYEHLVRNVSDRGKDTAIDLAWEDPELFRQIVVGRLRTGANIEGDFDELWPRFFVQQVGVEDSFNFLLNRTLMRPRDLLNLLHRCVEVAVNRGHDRVDEEDIRHAYKVYSEDILFETAFEIKDVFPDVADPIYAFLGCPVEMEKDDVLLRLMETGIAEDQLEEALELLLWFGFLGVQEPRHEDPQFSYHVRHNVDKLLASTSYHSGRYVVHHAFRSALECT